MDAKDIKMAIMEFDIINKNSSLIHIDAFSHLVFDKIKSEINHELTTTHVRELAALEMNVNKYYRRFILYGHRAINILSYREWKCV